ncbi:MAG: phosphoribosylformylglycinamidine synthase subunit PurQ [Pirellulaceae bacterium]
MPTPRVLLLRAPGTNCDAETAFAFESVGASVASVHVNRLIEEPTLGQGYQILCFPGGFSYGDDIAAGRILAQRLRVHLKDLVEEFQNKDRLILGICNGFQVMMRLGIFFPVAEYPDSQVQPPATLALNHQGRFEDRWVHLVNANSNSVFLTDVEHMYLPMAHAEGRFVMRDAASRSKLLAARQLGLRYTDSAGGVSDEPLSFPDNPNGAELNVAGISDPSGRVFGLMPHPERHIDPTQHPFWTRRTEQPEFGEGRAIFANAVTYFG